MLLLKKYFGIIFTLIILVAYFGYNFTISAKKRNNSELLNDITLTFNLRDITTSSKLIHKHETSNIHPLFDNVNSWVRSLGASIAVVDPTNEGWYDIYIATQKIGGKNQYFKNNRNGTFTEIGDKLKIANVNSPYPTYRPIFFDYDQDGYKDLLILSYEPKLFRNIKNEFFEEVKNHGLKKGTFYGGANMAEFHQDGHLDLIISPYVDEDAWYKPKTTVIMPDNFSDSTNGTPIQAYRNMGNGIFKEDQNLLNAIGHIGWGHAVGIFDIRSTGRKDIWFPQDYSTEKLYLNVGGNFKNVTDKLLQRNYGFGRNGMGIDFADVDNDGKPLIFISHIFEPFHKLSGNNLWKWDGGEYFKQLADERGVQDCGWAWGARFVDFDNDSNLDLIVVNGYISQDKKKNYWYTTTVLDASGSFIMQDSKNWPKMGNSSLAGYQKKCLYYNYKGTFVDVSSKTELKNNLLDGRGVIPIDILNNGSSGLVIVNQNGEAKIYINEQKNKNQWIGFKFKGTKSNIDGWGTIVKIYMDSGKILTRELQPLNGHGSQSEDRILVGLGENPKIEKYQFIWPSGKTEVIKSLNINQYHLITEPK